MRIGIVGCGTAGPAAATLLARMGHHVTAFERAHAPGPVGAGLLLQPIGMAVLAELGALDEILPRGSPVHRLTGRTRTGRPVLDLSYRDLGPNVFGLGVQRGTLFTALMNAANNAGVRLVTGVEIAEARALDPHNTDLIDAHGHSHGSFDLVVVADGARSALRTSSTLVRRDRAYRWGALWFMADDPHSRFDAVLSQVYDGTHRMVGVLPSGFRTTPTGHTIPRVSLFWSLRSDDWLRTRNLGVGPFRDSVRRLMPEAAELVEQLPSTQHLLFAEYRDAVMRSVHHGRVVFLGDAAHATSPQLGLGANLALVDARELAQHLSPLTSDHTPLDLTAALAAYAKSRRASVAYYQRVSRWLTPIFQSDLPLVGPLRDATFRYVCRFPPTRRQMLLGMAGVKNGWLRSGAVPTVATPT